MDLSDVIWSIFVIIGLFFLAITLSVRLTMEREAHLLMCKQFSASMQEYEECT